MFFLRVFDPHNEAPKSLDYLKKVQIEESREWVGEDGLYAWLVANWQSLGPVSNWSGPSLCLLLSLGRSASLSLLAFPSFRRGLIA